VGHSEENIVGTAMGALVAINGTGSGDVLSSAAIWRADELMVGKASTLLVDDRLWAFDDRAKLHVLDAKTGEPVARRIALGRVMRASPLYADGKVYALTANGSWYILQPDVFDHLDRKEQGAGGEIQLTDAMAKTIGVQPFHGVRFEGDRYDCGDKAGFVAANVAFALDRPALAGTLKTRLAALLDDAG